MAYGDDQSACVKLDRIYRESEDWEEMNKLRAHCLEGGKDHWVPTGPEDTYSDEQLKATPLYAKMKEALTTGGTALPESTILMVSRDAVNEMWPAYMASRQAELQHVEGAWALTFPEVCTRCHATLEKRCTTESGGHRSYPHKARTNTDYHPPDEGRPRRFTHDCYALCRDYDAGHGPGIFRIQKTGMKRSSKNGTYEFRILPGYAGNAITESIRVELHQLAEDGRKLPVIMYPPQSGDKRNLVSTEDIHEVASMSKVMRESELNGVQTPAIVFDLVNVVRQIEEGPD